jgi:pre-rRNA-processing protein TSR1
MLLDCSAVAKNKYIRHLQDADEVSHMGSRAAGASTLASSRSRASSLTHNEDNSDMANDDVDAMGAQYDLRGASLLVPGTSDHIRSGQYVTIELSEVDLSALAAKMTADNALLCAFSLLQHENKLSVLHFSVQRCGDYDGPIRAKDELIFQVLMIANVTPAPMLIISNRQTAFREFRAKPIYSESNLNCDKHKMERFLKVSYIYSTACSLSN